VARRYHGWIVAGVLAAVGVVVWFSLGLSLSKLLGGIPNAVEFLRDELPPDWTVLDDAWAGLVQTVQIAYLGTLFGVLISLPLSVLAARNLMPNYVATPVRLLLAGVRVLPALLWALLFVIIVGTGALAGVLAITLYSVGYLGKLQYESFEGLPRDGLDVARATGASRLQLARSVVVPESANAILSQALFMFEYNVRASTILGIVGAGGIGLIMSRYLAAFLYDRVITLLIVVFVAVVVIDWISAQLRARFLDESGAGKARWRDVFAGAFGLRQGP
jgi:phosphonate transport system permease protein